MHPEKLDRDLASSYRVLTSPSSARLPKRLWLVPGRLRSCLELDHDGSACGPTSLIARQGVWVMLMPVTGAAPTIYGIVPDGATVSGAAAKVAQSGNVYTVRPSSRRTGHFTIRFKRGLTVTMPIPAATGRPQ